MEFSDNVKVWLTCPKTHTEEVRLALGEAGLGRIGNYSHCNFVTEGKGYFRPEVDANPAVGEIGKIQEVDEVAIEFICYKNQLPLLKQTLAKHHPYEEPAGPTP